MVLECCVRGCKTVATNGLHSFPKDKSAAERWVMATKSYHLIERLNTNKLSNSFYKICRKHFNESDLQQNGKGQIVIKRNSTPSLFLPDDDNFQLQIPQTSTKSATSDDPINQSASMENGSDVDVEGGSWEDDIAEPSEKRSDHKARKVTNESRKSNMLCYYKRRAKELQQKLKTNKLNDSKVLEYLKPKFNAQLLEFVTMQLKNCQRSKHARRYTPKQKSLCLAMYKQGPKAYRFNEKWCFLPTKRTLGRYSAQLVFKAGVDPKILEAIKTIVMDWPQSKKYCSIGWDEVALSEHLDYCQSQDIIEGFAEMGKPKQLEFATHALTFMIRGIEVSYKQSIGYFYTGGMKSFVLVELIKLMIERILITGLIPILSVCDTCSTNANAVNGLVYPHAPQTKQTGNVLQYKVKGHRITHCFDPPHLIKVIRNNLQTKNLAHFISERWQPGFVDYDDGILQIAGWDDIRELYSVDFNSTKPMLKQLSKEHLDPSKLKMKVAVATQVFSESCGSEMLRYIEQGKMLEHCTSTARLLLFMNDLFDSVNGSDNHPADSLKGAVSLKSIHFEYWEYALLMLENMFFVDKTTGARNNRSSVLKKFESTIRGYQAVAKTCFGANISEVNIRNTTQDGLENFFGCVKTCNQSNKTTPSQYRTGYTTMVINNITGTNSLRANCQPDDSTAMLTNIHEFISVCQQHSNTPNSASIPEFKLTSRGRGEMNSIETSQSDTDEFESVILFDPETDDDDCAFSIVQCDDESEQGEAINRNSALIQKNPEVRQAEIISNDARWVCQKLLKTISCKDCNENFNFMDRHAALISIENLLCSLHETITEICSEDSIKMKLFLSIESAKINVTGCVDHTDVIERKVKNLAIDRMLLSFCTNINKFLSGKITDLPEHPTLVQKLAFEHRQKKRGVGKYAENFLLKTEQENEL